jgi:hypothetical protein
MKRLGWSVRTAKWSYDCKSCVTTFVGKSKNGWTTAVTLGKKARKVPFANTPTMFLRTTVSVGKRVESSKSFHQRLLALLPCQRVRLEQHTYGLLSNPATPLQPSPALPQPIQH